MASIWNNKITVSLFGESQGPAIGVVIDNLPPGEHVDITEVRNFLARRVSMPQGGNVRYANDNMIQVMSGLIGGKTTGTPLCAFIQNLDCEPVNNVTMPKLARPGHADYTGAVRYKGFSDVRDGGHSSDRLTIPLVFAGAICGQILERRGIYCGAHILQVHNIKDKEFDNIKLTREQIKDLRKVKFPVLDKKVGERMRDDIERAQSGGESLGGIVECAVINVPAGIGSPIFDGLENCISQLVFGIPNVMGIEFGAGFKCAEMVGSQNNDEFYVNEHGHVVTKTNNHGGILGGISSGMPITLKVAFKPNPTIAKPQNTVDYGTMENATLVFSGNHKACCVPNCVPCVESAVNIAILSNMLDYPNF